jgi:hypothetical protein
MRAGLSYSREYEMTLLFRSERQWREGASILERTRGEFHPKPESPRFPLLQQLDELMHCCRRGSVAGGIRHVILLRQGPFMKRSEIRGSPGDDAAQYKRTLKE